MHIVCWIPSPPSISYLYFLTTQDPWYFGNMRALIFWQQFLIDHNRNVYTSDHNHISFNWLSVILIFVTKTTIIFSIYYSNLPFTTNISIPLLITVRVLFMPSLLNNILFYNDFLLASAQRRHILHTTKMLLSIQQNDCQSDYTTATTDLLPLLLGDATSLQ